MELLQQKWTQVAITSGSFNGVQRANKRYSIVFEDNQNHRRVFIWHKMIGNWYTQKLLDQLRKDFDKTGISLYKCPLPLALTRL